MIQAHRSRAAYVHVATTVKIPCELRVGRSTQKKKECYFFIFKRIVWSSVLFNFLYKYYLFCYNLFYYLRYFSNDLFIYFIIYINFLNKMNGQTRCLKIKNVTFFLRREYVAGPEPQRDCVICGWSNLLSTHPSIPSVQELYQEYVSWIGGRLLIWFRTNSTWARKVRTTWWVGLRIVDY